MNFVIIKFSDTSKKLGIAYLLEHEQWVDWGSDKAKINDQVKTFKMNNGKVVSVVSVVSRKRTRGGSGGEGSSSSSSSSNSSGGGGKAKKRKKPNQIEKIKVVETEGNIGKYSPEARKERLREFMAKRSKRIWTKQTRYQVRTMVADSRLRVKGRFLNKEDEELLRAAMEIC